MSPRISVFTPSFNKGDYIYDALTSLQDQTMPDWEWWIMDNSTDEHSLECSRRCAEADSRVLRHYTPLNIVERQFSNPMALLLNRFYEFANGDIIMYLSDDDLFTPDCFKLVTDFMDSNPEESVCWFTLQLVDVKNPGELGPWPFESAITASCHKGVGYEGSQIDQKVDGGQIAHRKSCLGAIEYPWFPESAERHIAAHCDGVFMAKLGQKYTFVPVGPVAKPYVIHRYTPLHTWHPAGEIKGIS